MAAAAHDSFSSPKRVLTTRQLAPRKRFGQHFLTDARLARRIAAALPAAAHVLEIGGGTGTLTAALAECARHVVVIEIDRDLQTVLAERFAADGSRVEIINADALTADLEALLLGGPPPRAVCGNLPYAITTPLLERILACAGVWECAVLMVQAEYARRLAAKAGSPHYGSLTLFAEHFAVVERLFDVGAAGFYPAPRVASSVVRLRPRPLPEREHRHEGLLLDLVRASFAHRRKTLVNSILTARRGGNPEMRKLLETALERRGLPRDVRGERLALADFRSLAEALAHSGMERLS